MPDPEYEQYVDGVRKRLARSGPPPERRRIGGQEVELIGDAERVDPEWEAEEAKRRRTEWIRGRGERLAARRRQRDLLPDGARLDLVLRMLAIKTGGTRSRPIAAIRGGGREPSDPSRGVDRGHPQVEDYLARIRAHTRAIERILDADDGLLREEGSREGFYGHPGAVGGAASARMMRTAERDRIVFDDWQGIRSEVVAREAPYLGSSARTIERARAAEADRRGVRVRLVDGLLVGDG